MLTDEKDVNAAPSAAQDDNAAGSSAAGADAKRKDGEEEEQRVPYGRLKREIERRKSVEARTAELEKEVSEFRKNAGEESPYRADMPALEALKLTEERAAKKAYDRIKAENEAARRKEADSSAALDDAFDALRDQGHKITAKDQREIVATAEENGLEPTNPKHAALALKLWEGRDAKAKDGRAKFAERPGSAAARANAAGDRVDKHDPTKQSWGQLPHIVAQRWALRNGSK